MGTKLKIVDVARIPGRDDVMAVVDFVEGDLIEGCDEYVHTRTNDVWRIASIGTHPPNATGENSVKRLPLGLQPMGNDELSVGDLLESSDSQSTVGNPDMTSTTHLTLRNT